MKTKKPKLFVIPLHGGGLLITSQLKATKEEIKLMDDWINKQKEVQ